MKKWLSKCSQKIKMVFNIQGSSENNHFTMFSDMFSKNNFRFWNFLNFVTKSLTDNTSVLVQVMTYYQTFINLLPEPMKTQFSELEQLKCLRTHPTPPPPPSPPPPLSTTTIPWLPILLTSSYWILSPNYWPVHIWSKVTWDTFWSCLIMCVNVKWIQWVL